MTGNSKKFVAPLLALMFVFGVMVSGAGAAVTTGAAGFSIVAAPSSTAVNGDPVNLAIQVLDADGNINLGSNGQVGDVLFAVSSSLGTAIFPTGASGAAVNGGVGRGSFASINEVNLMPKEGKVLANVAYAGIAGTDTITVTMFESLISYANATISGDQIGAKQTMSVTVTEGGNITRITNVALTNNVDPTEIDGDATYVDQEETVAGTAAAFQVTTGAGESGLVTVEFVGIKQADTFGNNATGTTVSVDVNVNNGTGTGVATFDKAGYYEMRASANAGAVTYTKLNTVGIAANDVIGNRYALRVRPDVPTQLTLSLTKSVLDAITTAADATTDGMVRRVDQYGNRSGYIDATLPTPIGAPAATVTLSGSGTGTATFPAPFIMALGTSQIAVPAFTGGANAGTCNVLAAAAGLTASTAVPLIIAPDLTAGDTGGAAVSATILGAQIDNGAGVAMAAGNVVLAVGQSMKLLNITAGTDANDLIRLAAGQPLSLKLGTKTLTSAMVAAGQNIVDTDGDGTNDDIFTATFTLPTSTIAAPVDGILETGNGAFASYGLGNAAENDYNITLVSGTGVAVKIKNPNGFDLTGFNAAFRGRSFNFPNTAQNAHFVVVDSYGNNVTFAISGLKGTLTSSNLIGGNATEVNLGSDAVTDQLLTWPSTFDGTDTITLTPIATSGIPAITFDVTRIGVNGVSAINIYPAATETLANSMIPLVIETIDNSGRRGSAGLTFNLIITLETTDTLARLTEADGRTTIPTGSLIDTNLGGFNPAAGDATDGRLAMALDTGGSKGELTIRVQTVDGAVVAETDVITVAHISPSPLVPEDPPSGQNSVELTGDDRGSAPVTMGSVVSGGDQMNLVTNFPPYTAAVDIYVGVQVPDGTLFLVASDGSLTTDLVPYATGVTDQQSDTVFSSFEVCTPFGASVPTGTWNVYTVVAPTNGGDLSAIDWAAGDYDLTYYGFDVTCP